MNLPKRVVHRLIERLGPLPFRAYLAAAILVALLPVLVLATVISIQDLSVQRRELQAGLVATARALTAAVDAELHDSIDDLQVLAKAPAPPAVGPGAFEDLARYDLRLHAHWQDVAWVGADLRPAYFLASRGTTTIGSAGHAVAAEAIRDVRPIVHAVPPALPGGRPMIGIAVPVRRSGRVVGAVYARAWPETFEAILHAQALRSGWDAAIVSHRNVVLLGSEGAYEGRIAPAPMAAAVAAKPEALIRGRSLTGENAFIAVRRSSVAPWAIAFIAPASAIDRPAEIGWLLLPLLAAAVGLPLTALMLVGRFLRRRIEALADKAAAVSRDEAPPSAPPSFVREIDAVQEALRHAHEVLADRVAARDRLHEAEVALVRSQRLESVGQLTAAISHDLGNLIHAIARQLEVAQRAIGADAPQARVFAPALDLTREATSLMSELSSFARARAAKPQRTDLNAVIAEVRDLLRHAAGTAVQVRFALGTALWPCRVDRSLLKSALFNLVINARAAMPSGGDILISTRNASPADPPDGAPAAQGPDWDCVAVSVTDNGPGMPEEIRSRIFEPFFTTREADHGTGIGLSLLSGFVRASGGAVQVESEPGRGTTFTLYFPRVGAWKDRIGEPAALSVGFLPVSPDSGAGGNPTVKL